MARAKATREQIIGAAERLFARGGEEATSLRSITREAGVNVAAVHYHFGGRDQLLRLILDRRVGPLNTRRLALFEQAIAAYGEIVPVEELLRAFLRPDLELLDELRRTDVHFARFMGRAYSQPSPAVAGFLDDQFRAVSDRLIPLLQRSLSKVSAADLTVRLRLVVVIVTGLFAGATAVDEQGPLGPGETEQRLERLVAFVAPGLKAPSAHPDRLVKPAARAAAKEVEISE